IVVVPPPASYTALCRRQLAWLVLEPLALHARQRAPDSRSAGARLLESGAVGRLARGSPGVRAAPRGDPRSLLPAVLGSAAPSRQPRISGAAGELAAARERAAARQPARVRRRRLRRAAHVP